MEPLEALRAWLREKAEAGIALAFSGGVDSSLLLAVLAKMVDECPFPLLALTFHSVFQQETELAEVRRIAADYHVTLRVVKGNPLDNALIAENPKERCYHCKRVIFSMFRKIAQDSGLVTLLDGTHADDLGIFRPGLRALHELGVCSPLAELGIEKSTIRVLAQTLGLPCAERPGMPCLATRFPYGTQLTVEKLRRVARGEEALHALFPAIRNLRLRDHEGLARLEIPLESFSGIIARREEVVTALRVLGFRFVTFDLEGFRSGSWD